MGQNVKLLHNYEVTPNNVLSLGKGLSHESDMNFHAPNHNVLLIIFCEVYCVNNESHLSFTVELTTIGNTSQTNLYLRRIIEQIQFQFIF